MQLGEAENELREGGKLKKGRNEVDQKRDSKSILQQNEEKTTKKWLEFLSLFLMRTVFLY